MAFQVRVVGIVRPERVDCSASVAPLVGAEAEAAELAVMPPPVVGRTGDRLAPPTDDGGVRAPNESYVSITVVVMFCVPVLPEEELGPGAVGMSNVLEGRKDESSVGV
jgi:hypothetical protein